MNTTAATNSSSDAAARLGAAGLRSTAPRRAVLETLEPGGHLDAAEVFQAVKADLPGTSLQAVYGVLSALSDAGLLRKIEPAGGPARYEARVGDNHHHMICTGCGRIEDVRCVTGEAPCLAPSEDHDFEVTVAEVTFHGLCPDCRS